MNFRGIRSRSDAMFNGDHPEAPDNVSALRELFENNFKLSNLTKPFKFKNKRCGPERVVDSKNIALDVDAGRHRFPKSGGSKENRKKAVLTKVASPAGCYLNCKIENCCCKTFFRHYDEPPVSGYRPLPKVPLQERNGNSQFDRHRPDRWSTTSCSSYTLSKQQRTGDLSLSLHSFNRHPPNHKFTQSQNKFYNINYEFYKPKSREIFDEVPVSEVSTKHLEQDVSQTDQSGNLEEIKDSENVGEKREVDNRNSCASRNENGSSALSFPKTVASGLVNFNTIALNEGGNFRSAEKIGGNRIAKRDKVENAGFSKQEIDIEKVTGEQETRLHKIDSEEQSMNGDRKVEDSFSFKCRLPKVMNVGLRENNHPYNIKKPRLTVKGVKNRNMRSVKRRLKSPEGWTLSRSQTFSGYDNLAYGCSITNQQSFKQVELQDETDVPLDDADNAAVDVLKHSADKNVASSKNFGAVVRAPRPASISVIGVDDGPQFHLDSRMTCYDWPVTSFYIEGGKNPQSKSPKHFASAFHADAKQSCLEKNTSRVVKKTNLKRYRSLGYLEEEFFEYNNAKNHRSLENVNKASATREIQNVSKVNKNINAKKLQNSDVHVHALFAAVEHGHVEKTKTILESSNVNVNSVNSDGLSPLDVALLSNNKSLVKLLVTYGAQEGRKFYGSDLHNHLCHLLHEAESRVQELSGSLRLNTDASQAIATFSTSIPSRTMADGAQNRTLSLWERRTKGLKRMLTGFEQIRPPDPPSVVTVEVTSTSSIMVYFSESDNENSSMTTKFIVQLSHDQDFLWLCGHYETADTRQLKYHVKNLCKGQSYYVRVASGNIKGYSAYKLSTPAFVVPSSWQDVTKKDFRFTASLRDTLDGILTRVMIDHPYLKSNAEMFSRGVDLFTNQRRKKTSIKQLFAVSSKFQKHLKRGVYLACLLYHDDKVLVTNDDFLPVIEIDENYPRKIQNDFHWFFKVACNWNDLKCVKNDWEKLPNDSVAFRIELLRAAAHMQNILGLQDLGRLYHKMLRDVEGTIVLSVINHVHSLKSVSILNLRWMPLAKLSRKANLVNSSQSNLSDVLIASIPDQIAYHQTSKIKLPRGLYLSYLKMRSSVDSLEVLVPFRTPNILPHCKIRDNPHVTAEEWKWLVEKENYRESLTSATQQQRLFTEQIVLTTKKLFTLMDVSDEEAFNHRLYDAEVIEVNKDVSLIMIVPSADVSCSMPSQREGTLQKSHLLAFTVQAFEMIHFETYQPDLISLYSRLSCVLEMDVEFAQYNLRQAFNDPEVHSAKSKLHELETLQTQLNTAWKKSKWLLDVISFARDRFAVPNVRMHELLSVHPKRAVSIESNCVYAACDTGLDSPIHLKFLVSPRTTAGDIVRMFVKQTNMKGRERPISSDQDSSDFCLVAVDGVHEFSLHDDFILSQFEWPWKRACLYVRRRSSLSKTNENYSQLSYV